MGCGYDRVVMNKRDQHRISQTEWLTRIEAAKARDPLKYYIPNPKQREFHEATGNRILFLCGNGAGKSYAGTREVALALTQRHWIRDKYPTNRPLDMRICAEKQALTGKGGSSEAIIPMLKRLLKNDLEPGYPMKDSTAIECSWLLKNGSYFDILTYDQDDDKFESVSKDGIWFDEPPRESIYKASVARMRKGKGGVISFTMTPLFGAAWAYDRFIAQTGLKRKDLERVSIIEASTWVNCKCLLPDSHDNDLSYPHDNEGHCICNKGFIHKEALEIMIAEFDESELDARVQGKFISMRDLVYGAYDPAVHMLNDEIMPVIKRAS